MLKENNNSPNPFKINDNFPYKLVSVIYIIDHNENILMQLRDNNPDISCPNMWGPIGGHCEVGESPYDCCLRELFEETNYKETVINWYKNYLIPYDSLVNNIEHYISIFWANFDNQQKISCNEGQKICFLTLDNLKRLNMIKYNISWIEGILNQKKINKK